MPKSCGLPSSRTCCADARFGLGALAINLGEPCFGIVYLRPGHIRTEFTLATLDTLLKRDPDVEPPFILVASRREADVTLRLRLFKNFRKPPGGSEETR